jgi:predicted patatin/cPLA2 family phospholipase
MFDAALVVEGGGTKIAYTGGVLKCFLEHNIDFPYCVGISAGSEVLLPYVSHQPNRLEVTCIDAAAQPGVVGVGNYFKEGSLFAIERVSDFIEEKAPLDMEVFQANPSKLEIGLYDLKTKEIIYYPKEYVDKKNDLVKSSCALLLLSKPHDFDGRKVIDAGLRDMIPIEQAMRAGYSKFLVVSTKEKGYRRKPAPWWQILLAKLVYRDKDIVEDFRNRHLSYARQWDLIDQEEKEGRALVLRPGKDLGITRYTTDPVKLKAWFDLGYEETEARLDEIIAFLRK